MFYTPPQINRLSTCSIPACITIRMENSENSDQMASIEVQQKPFTVFSKMDKYRFSMTRVNMVQFCTKILSTFFLTKFWNYFFHFIAINHKYSFDHHIFISLGRTQNFNKTILIQKRFHDYFFRACAIFNL